jgi:uncharacterized protein
MRSVLALACILAFIPLSAGPGSTQTAPAAQAVQTPKALAAAREKQRQKANENLLVLMCGTLGAPYLQLGHDMAVVVNDGDNMRLIPAISDGGIGNIRDVLYLRNVDMGITTVLALNALKASGEFGPNLDRQIAYITPLSVDTVHILVRAGINSIEDLQGKKVSFNTKGSSTERFSPAIFQALGIKVTPTTMALSDAFQAMRNGDLDATVCACPKPLPAFPSVRPEWGFKLLDVPYVPALEQDYVPDNLTNEDYPNLIAKDRKVQTLATSSVLISFNWQRGSERYVRIEKFVNALFSNADKLRQPARHPAWRTVNVAANIRGWQRFPAAQEWLDRQAALAKAAPPPTIDPALARAQAARAAPSDEAEQERLFKEFLEWTRTRK